jgi:hypothetical protein
VSHSSNQDEVLFLRGVIADAALELAKAPDVLPDTKLTNRQASALRQAVLVAYAILTQHTTPQSVKDNLERAEIRKRFELDVGN